MWCRRCSACVSTMERQCGTGCCGLRWTTSLTLMMTPGIRRCIMLAGKLLRKVVYFVDMTAFHVGTLCARICIRASTAL